MSQLPGPFAPRGGWQSAYEELAYLGEALFAHEDEDMQRLASRIGGVLADWEKIDAERLRKRRIVIRSQARVRLADVTLDRRIARFAQDLLAQTSDARDHALYRRFFPESHEDVIDLGLDAEVPAATLVLLVLGSDEALPEVLRSHREPLGNALKMGNAALAERAEALGDMGRLGARIEAWKESANGAARSVRRALEQLAGERGWSERAVAAFFATEP